MARPRSDIKPRILHAARRRFLAEGVDGASLRTIARDAKTNVGMIFYYFPTKDDLFLAVVEERYAGLVEDLSQALSADVPARERLGAMFQRLGAATDDELEVLRLVLREALLVPSSPRFSRMLARFREGHLPMLLTTLAEGVSRGEIEAAVPLPLVLLTTVAMGGLPQIAARLAGREPPFSSLPPPAELASQTLRLLFDGIGARAGALKPRRASRRTRPPSGR